MLKLCSAYADDDQKVPRVKIILTSCPFNTLMPLLAMPSVFTTSKVIFPKHVLEDNCDATEAGGLPFTLSLTSLTLNICRCTDAFFTTLVPEFGSGRRYKPKLSWCTFIDWAVFVNLVA